MEGPQCAQIQGEMNPLFDLLIEVTPRPAGGLEIPESKDRLRPFLVSQSSLCALAAWGSARETIIFPVPPQFYLFWLKALLGKSYTPWTSPFLPISAQGSFSFLCMAPFSKSVKTFTMKCDLVPHSVAFFWIWVKSKALCAHNHLIFDLNFNSSYPKIRYGFCEPLFYCWKKP